MSERNSGEGNPFFGRKHDETTLEVMSQKSREGLEDRTVEEKDSWRALISRSSKGENNAFFGKKHNAKTRDKMSLSRANGIAEGRIHAQRGTKGWYESKKVNQKFFFDSFYECLRMQLLDADDSVKWWTKRHGIKIQYTFLEQTRHYVPDFFISYDDFQVIEEIKGYEVLEKKQAKYSALDLYAQEEGVKSRILEFNELNKLVQEHFGKSITQLRKEYKECQVVDV